MLLSLSRKEGKPNMIIVLLQYLFFLVHHENAYLKTLRPWSRKVKYFISLWPEAWCFIFLFCYTDLQVGRCW